MVMASQIELRHLLLEENEGEEEMGQLTVRKLNPVGPAAKNKTKPKQGSPGNVWAEKNGRETRSGKRNSCQKQKWAT
jgi:hypothetical protein